MTASSDLVARAETLSNLLTTWIGPDTSDTDLAILSGARNLIDEQAARIIALEADKAALVEALATITEGDWFRAGEPPYNIDGTNRKVAGRWAKLARATLAKHGGDK